MRLIPPDGSRDPRTEDPTNVWFVHLIGRALLPAALKLRLSANAVSVAGFLFGALAARALLHWALPWQATLGFALSVAWLIADGLDGMIARATGSASALGRFLDGVCDHAVFVLLYVALAASIDTPGAWTLASVAGFFHAVQSTLYEGERMRFHRRITGEAQLAGTAAPPNVVMRLYDAVAGSFDRAAAPFERLLARASDPQRLGCLYGSRAWPALRLLSLLSNNMRVILIYISALAGDVRLYWWIEIVPLSLVAVAGILGHRRIEAALVRGEGARWVPPRDGVAGLAGGGDEE